MYLFKDFVSHRKKVGTFSKEHDPVGVIDSSIQSPNVSPNLLSLGEASCQTTPKQSEIAGAPLLNPLLAPVGGTIPPDDEVGEIEEEDMSLAQCQSR
jgi:hypothetical protein